MALVQFYDVTPEQFKDLATKDESALYFLSNGQLYKGGQLIGNNIELITDSFPSTGVKGILYIKPSTGESKYWDGTQFLDFTKEITTLINAASTDEEIPTAAAVRTYASSVATDKANAAQSNAETNANKYTDSVKTALQALINKKAPSADGVSADSALKLTTSAGDVNKPVYFKDGVPVGINYTINKTVPSNAKFTDTTYENATQSAAGLMSAEDKKRLDGLTSGDKNQNAFSKVAVGSSTIEAETTTDTLTIEAGTNVTLTPDVSTDKITIAAKDTTYTKGAGINISNANVISNAGVRSISSGSANGTISVNTNGTTADVAVKGLGSAAYATKGGANGVAELDANGKVLTSQLPSYIDEVVEYNGLANFPTTGTTGIIYVDTAANKTYRWSGTKYVEISASLALGNTSSTAFRGDYGHTLYSNLNVSKGSDTKPIYLKDGVPTEVASEYVTLDTTQTITGNKVFTGVFDFSDTTGKLSSHYYHRLYSDNHVYVHYYPGVGDASTPTTFADLRVWDATNGTFKTLQLGGDGTLTWSNKKILTSSNYNDYALPLTAGSSHPLTGTLYFKTNSWAGNIIAHNASSQKRWEIYSNSSSGAVAATVLRVYNNTEGTTYNNYTFGTNGTLSLPSISTTSSITSAGSIIANGGVSVKSGQQLIVSTGIYDHAQPTSQCLLINSTAIPDGTTLGLKNAPGIGFHIANAYWASMVYDGAFKFINAAADGYTSVYASTFYGALSGNASTASQIYVTQTNSSSGTKYFPTFVSNTGGTYYALRANNGICYWTSEGTTSAVGVAQIGLGNNTPSGTAGNKTGAIYMFGNSSGYTQINPSNHTTNHINLYLPATGGTLALTSQLANYVPCAGGTMTGTLVINKSTDADLYTATSPALIVGGLESAAHIAIDNNEICAKGSGTTAAPLYLNSLTYVSATGNISTPQLYISSTSAAQHLAFSRGSYNYITTPASGTVAFVMSGKEIGSSTADLIISNGSVYPGSDNATNLGVSDRRWKQMYAVNTYTGNLQITGSISYKTDNFTSTFLKLYDDATTYGHTLIMGAGGTTYIGAGESAENLYNAISVKSTEDLYLTADNNIHFLPNCGTIANRKELILNTSLVLYPSVNNTGYIGASTYKFAGVHATNFYGDLSGTATAIKSVDGSNKIATAPGTAVFKFYYHISKDSAGIFPKTSNANAMITINKHDGNYDSQLGFSSDGNIYYRSFHGVALDTTTAWKTILDSANYTSYCVTTSNYQTYWPAAFKQTYRSGTGINFNSTSYLTGRVTVNSGSATNTNAPSGLQPAFTMWNIPIIQTAVDTPNHNATWQYVVQAVCDIDGNIATRLVSSGSTAGNYTYGNWKTYLHSSNYSSYALPRSAGSSYPLTGGLSFKTNSWPGDIMAHNASGQRRYELYSNSSSGAVADTILRVYTATDASTYVTYTFGTNGTLTATKFSGTLSGTASSANWLNTNSALTYGASGLQYFNFNGTEGTTANANVTPTSAYYHILRMNHANYNGYFADIAIPLNDVNGVYWRQVRNGTNHGWYKLLDSNNYTSYVVPKTGGTFSGSIFTAHPTGGETQVGVTHKTGNLYFWGNNYTGTRGIYDGKKGYIIQVTDTTTTFLGSLSGNASTATTANNVKGSYTLNGGQQNPNYFGTNKVGFLMMNTTVNGNSNYKDWMIMDCYNGSDVGGAVAIGVNRQTIGAYIMRSGPARTSWAESAELLHTSNSSKTASYSTGLSIGTVKMAGSTSTYYVPYATSSQAGVVSTAAQTFAGVKTFNNGLASNGNISLANSAYIVGKNSAGTECRMLTITGNDNIGMNTSYVGNVNIYGYAEQSFDPGFSDGPAAYAVNLYMRNAATASNVNLFSVGGNTTYGNTAVSTSSNYYYSVVRSSGIYNRTTTSAANVFISSSGSVLMRSTSASKYKLNIKKIEQPDSYYYNTLKLSPKQWNDKGSVEAYANYLTKSIDNNKIKDEEEEKEFLNNIDITPVYGLVAEDVEKAGLEKYCVYAYDEETQKNEIEGIQYDRLWIPLIPVVRDIVLSMQKILPVIIPSIRDEETLAEVLKLLNKFNSFNEADVID